VTNGSSVGRDVQNNSDYLFQCHPWEKNILFEKFTYLNNTHCIETNDKR
jgi:hypothetical protein